MLTATDVRKAKEAARDLCVMDDAPRYVRDAARKFVRASAIMESQLQRWRDLTEAREIARGERMF